jgi:hypothetical protein
MAVVWKELAGQHTKPGYVAYTHQKSAMYEDMARECKGKFMAAKGTWPEEGMSLSDHIRRTQDKLLEGWS